MAELIVRAPGEPDRVVALKDRSVVVGRGGDCDVRIADKRSSRRHLQVSPQAAGAGGLTWVATDLHSANGTFVGEDRILRRGLDAGDVLRIGETTLEFSEASTPALAAAPVAEPARASIVSGSLLIQPAVAPSPAPAAAPVPVAVPAVSPTSPPAVPSAVRTESVARPDARPDVRPDARPEGGDRQRSRHASRSLTRAAAFVVIGIAAVVGVEVFLGDMEKSKQAQSDEVTEYTALLEDADLPFPNLEGNFKAFEDAHPESKYVAALRAYVDAKRVVYDREAHAEEALEAIQRGGGAIPASEARTRLLDLERKFPNAQRLKTRIDLQVAELDRRRDDQTSRDRVALETDVDRLLSRNDPGSALRRIGGFRQGHPRIPPEDRDRLSSKETEAAELAARLADKAIEDFTKASDPDAKRAPILAVLPGLAGTKDEERLVVTLREGKAASARPEAGAGSEAGSAGSGGTPSTAGISPEIIAKAGEAESLARSRRFDKASESFSNLLATIQLPPRLKKEWEDRADELKRLVALEADLTAAIAASGDKPLHPKLAEGVVDLLSADGAGIKVRHKDAEETHAWSELPAPDVLTLLSRPRPTPDQRLALAILAIELGERKACVDELIALLEIPTHKELAFRVAARRLEGRTSVPEGGYFVLDGELLAKAEYDRRMEARRIDGLRAEAAQILAKVEAEPGFKKLALLKEKRDELDKRRAYALLAIFDEKHWPYPHSPPQVDQGIYETVTAEIDRRIKLVYDVWDDPLTVHVLGKGNVTRETPVGKMLERHEAICKELEAKGKDVADLRGALKPLAMYVTDEPLTVRNYFRDDGEKELFAYNKWVLETYNPARTAWVTAPEREQIQITNDYRMVMGFTMNVAPGPETFEQITDKNVVKILDGGKETGRQALRAVRIDDRLVRSARGHSIDMNARGYFAHEAPPPAPEGVTPFDRMQASGYSGGGASENIAGAGSPMDAHMRWRHSSGHHRNILSGWYDMGCGVSGNLWTQNFGAGGIPEIGSEPPAEPQPYVQPPSGPPGKPPKKSK